MTYHCHMRNEGHRYLKLSTDLPFMYLFDLGVSARESKKAAWHQADGLKSCDNLEHMGREPT